MERRTRIIFMGTVIALGLIILFAAAHALYTTFKPTSFTVTYDQALSNSACKKIHGILKGTITHVPIQELHARIARRVPAAQDITLYYRGVRHVHVKITAHQPYFILDSNTQNNTLQTVLTQEQTIAPITDYASWTLTDLPLINMHQNFREQLAPETIGELYTFLDSLLTHKPDFFQKYQITWHDKTTIDLQAQESNTCSIRALYATVFDTKLCAALQKIPCAGTAQTNTWVDVRYKDQLVVTHVSKKK